MTTARAAALAIDGSEWFHDPAWSEHVSSRHWRRLPMRASTAIRLALQALAAGGPSGAVCATFFVPPTLATLDPGLVRDIAAAGHEVALVVSAVDDWAQAKFELEQVLQRRVHGVWRLRTPIPGAELHAAGFDYEATPDTAATGTATARKGPQARFEMFPAWRLDGAQPRLAGLPKAVFRAHYDQLSGAVAALQSVAQRGGGTLAQQLDLRLQQEPEPRPASPPVPAPVAPRADVPRLAIVVPLKDEEQGIGSLFVELDAVAAQLASLARCEFVFVDDGSRDRTWPLLRQHAASRPHTMLVQHAANRGVAAAIHSGVLATDAEFVASIDGDLSYDPMELLQMLPLLAEAEVVTASPYDPRGGVRNVPGWRLFLSRTLSRGYRLLLRRRIHTWTSCFRLYRRAAVADLPVAHPGFLGTAELLVRVLRRGGRVVEHPCVLEARLFGFSKMRVLRTIGGHLQLLWQVARGRIN